MLLITIWADSFQSSPMPSSPWRIPITQRPSQTQCNDISQQSLLLRPVNYTSSSQSPQWFIYLSAYILFFSIPYPHGQHHTESWWWLMGRSCSLAYLVPVHPTGPAQPQSPVWPEALRSPFFLISRSIHIAKVICNTRNLGLTSSYRIILYSCPAKIHSLQAA